MPLLACFRSQASPPTRLHSPSPSQSYKQDRIPESRKMSRKSLHGVKSPFYILFTRFSASNHWFVQLLVEISGHVFKGNFSSFWLALSWKIYFCLYIVHGWIKLHDMVKRAQNSKVSQSNNFFKRIKKC